MYMYVQSGNVYVHVHVVCVNVNGVFISALRYLNYSVTKLRSQDTLSVIVYISRNIHGRYLAWNFIRNNWSYIAKMYVIIM